MGACLALSLPGGGDRLGRSHLCCDGVAMSSSSSVHSIEHIVESIDISGSSVMSRVIHVYCVGCQLSSGSDKPRLLAWDVQVPPKLTVAEFKRLFRLAIKLPTSTHLSLSFGVRTMLDADNLDVVIPAALPDSCARISLRVVNPCMAAPVYSSLTDAQNPNPNRLDNDPK